MRFPPFNQLISILAISAILLGLNAALFLLDTGPGASPLFFQFQLAGALFLGAVIVPVLCFSAVLRPEEEQEDYVHGYACWVLAIYIAILLLLVFAEQPFWYPLPQPTSANWWLPSAWFVIAMLPLLALHGGIAIIRELKLRLMARHPGSLL